MGTMYLQTFKMLVYIVIGMIFKKKGLVGEKAEDILSEVVIKLTLPCAIISFFVNSIIKIPVKEFVLLLLSVMLGFFILSIFGKISARIICRGEAECGVWEYMILFSNNIYIGFPVIQTLLGKEALIYATLICIPCNALIFSYGIYLASVGGKIQFSWKKMMNTASFASLVAVVLLYCPFQIPLFIEKSVSMCGALSTPLALVLLGAIIAEEFNIKEINIRRSIEFSVARLLLGAILVGIEYSVLWIEFDLMKQVMILTAALPASNFIIILAKQYKNSAMNLAIEGVVVSTGAYLILAPVIQEILFLFF